MKRTAFLVLITFCVFLLTACKSTEEPKLVGFGPEDVPGLSLKDGEQKTYFKDGKVEYVIPVANGKAEGLVKRYDKNGKLYNETEYKNGLKNGRCTYFFPWGKVFSEVQYVNGAKEGTETKYYDDGHIASEGVYKEGKLQPGIKEYNKDGTVKTSNVTILVKNIDKRTSENKYLMHVTLSDPNLVPYFYVTGLTSENKRVPIKMIGNTGEAEFSLAPGSYVKRNLLIEAEYKSGLGNTLTVKKQYTLVIN